MKWKTWPNFVTALGFVLVGLYVWAYSNERGTFAVLFLALAGLSDFLDGYLARRLNQISPLGRSLDPIRDRALMLAVLLNFYVIYGTREVAQFIAGILVFEVGMIVVNAMRGFPFVHILGKVRGAIHVGCTLILTISFYVVPFLKEGAHLSVLALMAFASLAAFVGYLFFPEKTPAIR